MDLSVGADLFVEATPLYRHDTRISIADALSRNRNHSFGHMTCGSPARADDLGRRAGRATCAVGGQRNPLSYQQDKIVDFSHLEANSGLACVPEIASRGR